LLEEKIKIKTTKTFDELEASKKRISIFQGGARSGKTYNIVLWLIIQALKINEISIFTIARKTLPALKASALRDFINILTRLELFNDKYYNKSDYEYRLNGHLFEFISLDQPDKVKSRKRDLLFLPEATEDDYDSWVQLSIRTTKKIILDYNPAAEYHWIYDMVIPRDDADFYHSTYLDNPFLEQGIISEIKKLEKADENLWKIYGLGERGTLEGLVFTQFQFVKELPQGKRFYGLDFGYTNDPTAFVEVIYNRHGIYVKELIYERGLNNLEIRDRFRDLKISPQLKITADSSEPKSINELKIPMNDKGYNVRGAAKGPDSIKKGIDLIKQHSLFITEDSVNLIKELRNYKWEKNKDGKGYVNKPVDAFNHAIDAMRYACMDNINKYELQIL